MKLTFIRNTLFLFFLGIGLSFAGPRENTPEYYLNLSTHSTPPDSYHFQLQAADGFLKRGDTKQAQKVLDELPDDTTPAIIFYRQLLDSEIKLSSKKIMEAIQPLRALNPAVASSELQERYYQLLATAYLRQNKPLESVKHRILLDRLLDDNPSALVQNRQDIWKALMQLSAHTLKLTRIPAPPDVLGGWLALAYISKNYQATPEELKKAIDAWKKSYPGHPANQIISEQFNTTASAASLNRPEKIAVLLPLGEGPHQSSAQAILDGFMSNYYASSKKPSIKIYDTSANSAKKLYNKAVEEGADWIVGPLTKAEVNQITDLSASDFVPTLLLNMPESLPNNVPLYAFALTPESEGTLLAQRLWQDGNRRIVMVSTAETTQQRILSAFNDEWKKKGGQIVAQSTMTPSTDRPATVQQLLQIEKYQARAKKLKQETGQTVPLEERRRQDIDAILLIASSEQAHQIRPLFDFYYAQDLPLYTSASFYQGIPNPNVDHDMNNAIFGDMPWIVDKNYGVQPSFNTLKGIWVADAARQPRLLAFGMDAYQLALNYPKWQQFPQLGFMGATGTLYIDPDHTVQRQIAWAKIKEGIPRIL